MSTAPATPADLPRRLVASADLDALDFAKGGGLLPVIAQHASTGEGKG